MQTWKATFITGYGERGFSVFAIHHQIVPGHEGATAQLILIHYTTKLSSYYSFRGRS